MRRYYTRACNFYYGKKSKNLVDKKRSFPLNGNKEISFDYVEIISRQSKKYGTQFLIDAKIEPGDDSIIKISPSFQATQSNMNQAHGGRKPKFYDIVIQQKSAELIYYTIHNEEGARFWKKSNWNVIVKLDNPNDNRIKGNNYKWVSLSQIKKLSLKSRLVNPFVKTILFMI